jgi:hypothetical protein
MDIVKTVHDLTVFLIPLLPYLTKAGEGIAEETGKKIAGSTWENAKNLWARLSTKIKTKSSALEAVEDVLTKPGNEDAQASFRNQLVKLLETDGGFASELSTLWDETKPIASGFTQSGERNVYIGGTNSGNIITGDNNQH